MWEWFRTADPVVQAFVATLGTYLLTALGTLPVLFFRSAPRRLLDGMMGFAAGKDKMGRIDAISVETGRTVWSWETRVANYSPILATGGGLLFNGSMDRYLRALDSDSGRVLCETRLPSQVVGGAITYSVRGRQYVAIAAGGGNIAGLQVGLTPEADTTSGSNAMYVFALPQ